MYTSWVLILTIVTGWNNATGAAVHSIPNFISSEQCIAAGNAWLKQNKQSKDRLIYTPTAVCVKQTMDLPSADQLP